MARHCDFLEKIAPLRECWRIHVRVIRLWTLPSFKNPESVSSIEMVMMDEQGTTMHASVGRNLVSMFVSLLSEGAVYVFAYFGVGNNYGLYRTTTHPFKLFFQERTTVRPSFCDAIPLYGIKLVPFREIKEYSIPHPFLVDVAGVMTDIEGERQFVKDGKTLNILVIHIENDGLKLSVAVLGEMAAQIKGFVVADGQQLPVVVFQFARVKTYGGINVLQNIMYGTRLLINPDVPEAVMLRERETLRYLSVLSGQPANIVEDEFLYLTERKTIKELRHPANVGFYVVMATVLAVDPVPHWWYKSCVCGVKVEANADTYFCDGCTKDVINVVDRYMLDLVVFDGTATTSFIVFDKEATVLFGRTCTEMVKELNDNGTASIDPTYFQELLLDKDFLFKVQVKNTRWAISYDVSRISSDPTILARWRVTQGPVNPGLIPAGHANHSNVRDFLIPEKKRSIEQLKCTKEGGIYCVLVTGLEVSDHGDWWHPTCKCGKNIMIIGAAYYCEECGCVAVAIPRYRIKLRVVDHSGSATFVLHDREGRAMLGKSCSEILEWFQTEGWMFDQPPDFAQLLDKEIIFKVKSNSSNNLDLRVNFDVIDFCSDEWIINEFKSPRLPVNSVQHGTDDECSVWDESPDPIMEHSSATERLVARRLLDDFNNSGVVSLKRMH